MNNYKRTFFIIFISVMLMYIFFFALGWHFTPRNITAEEKALVQKISAAGITNNMSLLKLGWNNTLVILTLISGLFTVGFTTLGSLIFNGFVTGSIFSEVYANGVSLNKIIQVTLPHSIEFIGIWLAAAVGLHGAIYFYRVLLNEKTLAKKEIRFLLLIVMASIIIIWIAAILEIKISIRNI